MSFPYLAFTSQPQSQFAESRLKNFFRFSHPKVQRIESVRVSGSSKLCEGLSPRSYAHQKAETTYLLLQLLSTLTSSLQKVPCVSPTALASRSAPSDASGEFYFRRMTRDFFHSSHLFRLKHRRKTYVNWLFMRFFLPFLVLNLGSRVKVSCAVESSCQVSYICPLPQPT